MIRLFLASLLICGSLLLVVSGCSDDDIIGTSSEPSVDPSSITFYFPVDRGFTSTFEIFESDGRYSTMNFKVGSEVPFGSTSAYQWFHGDGTSYDTSFVVVQGAGLYLYDNTSSVPERVLQGPLGPGARWTRYPTSNDQADTVSIVTGGTDMTDIIGGDDGSEDNGGAAVKVFPTVGSNELRVERIETIVLRNGSAFSGCAKIVNQQSDGSTNQYWFAPGFGLVKYVIGATQSYPAGRKNGELVSYIK